MNQQMLEGRWTEIKGQLRSRWGQLNDNELELNKGNVQQLLGYVERKTGEKRAEIEKFLDEGGNGRSMAEQATAAVRDTTAAAAEGVQHAAQSVSDASMEAAERVRESYEYTEELVKRHPIESLAICFGAGLIAGVVVGVTFLRPSR